jgi:hypothetical protein
MRRPSPPGMVENMNGLFRRAKAHPWMTRAMLLVAIAPIMLFATACSSNPPIGSYDVLTAGTNTLTVSGWAVDPNDWTRTVQVHVYDNAGLVGAVDANGSRPDVGAVYPSAGNNHGFTYTFPATAGAHWVCLYLIDTTGTTNPSLGCKTGYPNAAPNPGDPIGTPITGTTNPNIGGSFGSAQTGTMSLALDIFGGAIVPSPDAVQCDVNKGAKLGWMLNSNGTYTYGKWCAQYFEFNTSESTDEIPFLGPTNEYILLSNGVAIPQLVTYPSYFVIHNNQWADGSWTWCFNRACAGGHTGPLSWVGHVETWYIPIVSFQPFACYPAGCPYIPPVTTTTTGAVGKPT